MKKLTLLILILFLLAALCACDLEANSDITAQPSGSTTNESTQPTETITQPSESVEPWDANELRAMFPPPPEKLWTMTGAD